MLLSVSKCFFMFCFDSQLTRISAQELVFIFISLHASLRFVVIHF